jgi:hypothetical protein
MCTPYRHERALALGVAVLLGSCQAQVSGENDSTEPGSGGAGTGSGGAGGRAVAGPPGQGSAGAGGGATGAGGAGTGGMPAPGASRDGAAPAAGGADGGAGPAAGCRPTTGGPHWLEEGQTLMFRARCETGAAAPGGAFSLDMLPRGATFDAATATFRWTPGLDQGATYYLTLTARPWNETADVKIGVADKFDDPANVPIADPAKYNEEFGLPVFHLMVTPDLDRNMAQIQARQNALWANSCMPLCGPSIYSPVTVVYRGHTYKAEGHYRGASSLSYPKKNYTLRFDRADKFNEPVLAGGKIKKRRKLALITTFDDNSYLRWRMAFEAWNRMDPANIKIPHFSAVVFVGGRYQGLYTVSDKIDDDMLEDAGLNGDGNAYMGINHGANLDVIMRAESGPMAGMARPKVCPYEGFTKKEGLPEECNGTAFVPAAYDDLVKLIDFVAKSDDARFTAEVSNVLSVKDYTNWFVHATAIIANDSYGKNAVHYHDPVAGGPWRVVIWDYNASWGQQWHTVRQSATSDPRRSAMITTPGLPATNNLWRRLYAHPTLGPQMRARYAEALKNELKVESLLAMLEAMAKEVDASAKRDERKWQAQYRRFYGMGGQFGANRTDFTTYVQEIDYLRAWIPMRWNYLKTLFP